MTWVPNWALSLDLYNLEQAAHLSRIPWSYPWDEATRMYLLKNNVCQQLPNVLRAKDTNLIQFSSWRSSQFNGPINIAKKKKEGDISCCGGKNNGPQRCPPLSPGPGNVCCPSSPGSGGSLLLGAFPTSLFLCVPHRDKVLTAVLGSYLFPYLPVSLVY